MVNSSALSKWIRPSTVIWFTVLLSYLIFFNPEIRDSYIKLLETAMIVVYTSYFVGRSSEKIFIKKEDENGNFSSTSEK